MKPLGIEWPKDPIKALQVFSYDKKTALSEELHGKT